MTKAKAAAGAVAVQAPTVGDFLRAAEQSGSLEDWQAAQAVVEAELAQAEGAFTAAFERYRLGAIEARSRGDEEAEERLGAAMSAARERRERLEVQAAEVRRRVGEAARAHSQREHAAKLRPLGEAVDQLIAEAVELEREARAVHVRKRRVLDLLSEVVSLTPPGHAVHLVHKAGTVWDGQTLDERVESWIAGYGRTSDIRAELEGLKAKLLAGGFNTARAPRLEVQERAA